MTPSSAIISLRIIEVEVLGNVYRLSNCHQDSKFSMTQNQLTGRECYFIGDQFSWIFRIRFVQLPSI